MLNYLQLMFQFSQRPNAVVLAMQKVSGVPFSFKKLRKEKTKDNNPFWKIWPRMSFSHETQRVWISDSLACKLPTAVGSCLIDGLYTKKPLSLENFMNNRLQGENNTIIRRGRQHWNWISQWKDWAWKKNVRYALSWEGQIRLNWCNRAF